MADAGAKFEHAKSEADRLQYPKWKKRLEEAWKRAPLWCKAYRSGSEIGGNHTNNYCENTIRIFKGNFLTFVPEAHLRLMETRCK